MKIKNDSSEKINKAIVDLDQIYSNRFIELDPAGYFLIKLNRESLELIVEHYSNQIDSQGIALDPDTGEPLKCKGKKREPLNIFKGKSAKEIGIKLTEGKGPYPVSKLDHALYLGRELQKAEFCLINEVTYEQD